MISNETILILPIALPLLTAIILLLGWGRLIFQRIVYIVSSTLVLAVACLLLYIVNANGVVATQVGDWKAPFGITLVADMFSAIMIMLSAIIAFTASIYSFATIDKERERFGFYPLIQTLLMGVNGSFLTGDIFNLYVWFEVMLMSSFALIALGGERKQLEGALKYVTLNLLSSALFLASAGVLYGLVGTLNMADLSIKIAEIDNAGAVEIVAMLLLLAFGIKSAVFPLFFWLPASYHTPPVVVSAIFAGLLTKVGVYALFRVFTLLFAGSDIAFTVILIISAFTMLSGVLGAVIQMDFRKILSFHIISQIGYMIMGLGLFTQFAVAGGIFYILHHIIVKTNLFYISGLVERIQGSNNLKKLGGLYKVYPWLGVLFLIPAMSLAGMPPLSGFWSKFMVVKAGILTKDFLVVGVALFVGLLTLFSMTKIWNEAFWKNIPDKVDTASAVPFRMLSLSIKLSFILPIVILAIITIAIGFFVEDFFALANTAAEQLMNPTLYRQTVLRLP